MAVYRINACPVSYLIRECSLYPERLGCNLYQDPCKVWDRDRECPIRAEFFHHKEGGADGSWKRTIDALKTLNPDGDLAAGDKEEPWPPHKPRPEEKQPTRRHSPGGTA